MYLYKNPELEVCGLVLIYSEEIKAMKACAMKARIHGFFCFGIQVF